MYKAKIRQDTLLNQAGIAPDDDHLRRLRLGSWVIKELAVQGTKHIVPEGKQPVREQAFHAETVMEIDVSQVGPPSRNT